MKRLPEQVENDLKFPFQKILSIENFGDPANEIVELIAYGNLSSKTLKEVLQQYNIKNLHVLKDRLLDVLLAYIYTTLDDNYITQKESIHIQYLKHFFSIEEGDFYNKKYNQVQNILVRQVELMYENNEINSVEALHKVELQQIFDLSYDQFLDLIQPAVDNALSRGANPLDLDTFIKR